MELPSAMMIMLMLISTVNTLLHSSSPFSKETTEQASISTNNITSVILKSIINVSTTLPPPPSSSTTAKQMNTTILKWKQQSHQNIPTNVNNNNNNENNRNQKNSNVYRFDLPEDGKTQNVRKILSSSSTTTSTMEKNIQTSPASNSIINMPKRINYFGTQQQPNQQQPSSSLLNLDLKNKQIYGTKSTAKNTMTNVNQNDDKNWLLTKAWLIDNINRLRRELSELQRDYAKHIDDVHRDNLNNQKQLIEDVTKLKTDHQFLSQQQKQIIYLIKRSHYLKTKSNDFKLKLKMADAPVQHSLTNTKSTPTMELSEKLMKRPMVKRDISRRNKNQQFNHYEQQQQQQQNGEKFETETKRNMEEIFSELSALHDISLILFDDLKTLERKIDIRDKFLG